MRVDPLSLLERNDKWYLGGGRAAMFAPAFPRFLDPPVFWDETYYADIRIERLFCLLFLDENGRPLSLRRATRHWTPDRLTQIYTVEGVPGLQIHEDRVVTPNDSFASRLTFQHTGATSARLNVLLWSLQPSSDLPENENAVTIAEVQRDSDAFSFAYRLRYAASGETPAEVYGWGELPAPNSPSRGEADNEQPNPPLPYTPHPTPYTLFLALGASRLPDS